MRETAGSAAARTARCRNCRRGSLMASTGGFWAGYHAVARTTRAEPSRARVEIMSLSDELLSLSSVEMRRRIGTKEISPVELVGASIARIQALNPAVNAIAATDFAHARKLAISAE